MTTVTITITETNDELQLEGKLDNPNAINEPPTAALIVGSYLAANVETVVKDAMRWFKDMSTAAEPVEEATIKAPKIILPGNDIEGAPV